MTFAQQVAKLLPDSTVSARGDEIVLQTYTRGGATVMMRDACSRLSLKFEPIETWRSPFKKYSTRFKVFE